MLMVTAVRATDRLPIPVTSLLNEISLATRAINSLLYVRNYWYGGWLFSLRRCGGCVAVIIEAEAVIFGLMASTRCINTRFE